MAEGKMPEKIWVERVGIGADDIAMLASSLPIRSTLYYRSDSVEGLVKALEASRLKHLSDGLWESHETIAMIDSALSRFRSLQNGSTSSPGQG